jgi:YHS domain-containing protein
LTERRQAGFASSTAATILAAGGSRARGTEDAIEMSPDAAMWSAHRNDERHPYKEVAAMADNVTDPVCGMQIRPEDAVAREEHEGTTFYFCSPACHTIFVKDPHSDGHLAEEHGGHGGHEGHAGHGDH